MKKVLWFSRHPLSAEQMADLERIYGACEVTQVNRTIQEVAELRDEIASHDVIAIVAPLALQSEFLRLAGPDKPVIFCKNDRILLDDVKVEFRHAGWFRIREIKTVFEEL